MITTVKRLTGSWVFEHAGDHRLLLRPRPPIVQDAAMFPPPSVVDTADLPDLLAVVVHAMGLPAVADLQERLVDLRAVRDYLRSLRGIPSMDVAVLDQTILAVSRAVDALLRYQEGPR